MGWNTSTVSKIILCSVLFLMNISLVCAEDTDAETETEIEAEMPEPELKHIFSLDTNFTMTALRNYGYGLGVNYERKLTNFLSIKPGFGHMTIFSDVTVVTVDLQLFLYYYPLSSGLDKLYVGLGNGCDFIMYTNGIPQDTAITLTPILGWKWRAFKFLMIEPFIGWKFFLVKTNNYEKVDRYLNEGFQWGLSFKFFLQK
jgi:hypothetical protein